MSSHATGLYTVSMRNLLLLLLLLARHFSEYRAILSDLCAPMSVTEEVFYPVQIIGGSN